jgi:hypothetical protein
MVGDQHADAAMLQMRHQIADFAHRDRVDARQRLVQQDVIGLRRQGAGNLDTPPLAAGQRQCRRAAQMRDAELRQQLRPASSRRSRSGSTTSSAAMMFCSTFSPRNTLASCGR